MPKKKNETRNERNHSVSESENAEDASENENIAIIGRVVNRIDSRFCGPTLTSNV